MSKQAEATLKVRLSEVSKRRLKIRAAKNNRSMSAEAVTAIEQALASDAGAKAAGKEVGK